MLNDPTKVSENEAIEVRCYFVRKRNALLVRGDFGTIYRDYYLHLMQHEIRHQESLDTSLKHALAGLALHLASRPRTEAAAWTLSWQQPRYNLFVTGSNRLGNITGRIFTEDVRAHETSLFFAQATSEGHPARQSTIAAQSEEFFEIVEDFYQTSEQRSARIFRHGEEDFVMVTAQPDCDLEWLDTLTDESIRTLDQKEEMSLLETRYYTFDCGCSLIKLLPVISSLSKETQDEVFGADDEPTIITCPRCAARFVLTQEMLRIYIEKMNSETEK
ncbi:MAG: Hsp33 family molecular chaperone HslO [Verrucomicrobiales bacterium]